MAVTTQRNEPLTFQDIRSTIQETRRISGNVTIGAAGAITAQYGPGITWVHTSAGLYTGTLSRNYRKMVSPDVIMGGALPVPTTTGINPFPVPAGCTGGQVQFQFYRSDTGAAADPASGTVMYYDVIVSDTVQ